MQLRTYFKEVSRNKSVSTQIKYEFALQYVTKLYAVRAANENTDPQSYILPRGENLPSTLHSNSSITTSLGFGFFCQFLIINANRHMWIRNEIFLITFPLGILKNCKEINTSQFSAVAGLQDWGSQISATTNKIL